MSSIIVELKRHIIINIIIDRKIKLKKNTLHFSNVVSFFYVFVSKMNRVIFHLCRIIDI